MGFGLGTRWDLAFLQEDLAPVQCLLQSIRDPQNQLHQSVALGERMLEVLGVVELQLVAESLMHQEHLGVVQYPSAELEAAGRRKSFEVQRMFLVKAA